MSSQSEKLYKATQKMIATANFKLQNPIGMDEIHKNVKVKEEKDKKEKEAKEKKP
jgi:hypothetical protein